MGIAINEYGKLAMVTIAGGSNGVPKFSKYAGALQWGNAIFLWVNIGGEQNSNYNNEFDIVNISNEHTKHNPKDENDSTTVDGKYCTLTWYGNSKMHQDSELTKLILKYGERKNESSSSSSSSISSSSSNSSSNSSSRCSSDIDSGSSGSSSSSSNNNDTTGGNNNSNSSSKHVLLFVRMVNKNYTCLGRLGVVSCTTSSTTAPVKFSFILKDYAHVYNKEYFNSICGV